MIIKAGKSKMYRAHKLVQPAESQEELLSHSKAVRQKEQMVWGLQAGELPQTQVSLLF